MDARRILAILYDLSVTIGEQTSLQPLLTRVLQRFLYHTSYPAGFVCTSIPTIEHSSNTLRLSLDAAVGDFDLIGAIGQMIEVPCDLLSDSITSQGDRTEALGRFELVRGRYQDFLFLPIPGQGGIVLLSRQVLQSALRLKDVFQPALAQLSRAIVLCRRSDQQISQLESDRILFGEVFESSSSGIMITNVEGTVVAVNGAFTRITGYTANEMIGSRPNKLGSGRHDQGFYQELWRSLREEGYWQGEIWNRRRSGEAYPEWLSISRVCNSHGDVTHYVGIFSDLSAEREAESLRHRISFFDSLTDLPNRRLLLDRLSQACSLARNAHTLGAVLAIDLNGFKSVNNKGHEFGNLVLREAATRLSSCARPGDTVSRIGGDEFVCILNTLGWDPTDSAALARNTADMVQHALAAPYHVDGEIFRLGASIGIAMFSGEEFSVDELLKRADHALTLAKRRRTSCIQFYDPDVERLVAERSLLIAELHTAIEEERLELHFQAQVDARQRIVGAEVLVRWTHPVHGRLSPATFIPLAEETGLIIPLGRWILKKTCERLAEWRDTPCLRGIALAVNVSSKQFMEDSFSEHVESALADSKIDPSLLKIELTEGAMVHNFDEVVDKMQRLKRLGITIALDDFGTGYSSLQYLTRLPIDQLKIDGSFVRDLGRIASSGTIIKTIIGMAKSLNIQVIAEGVETERQRSFLEECGCHTFQGFLYSEPISGPEFTVMAASYERQGSGRSGIKMP
jgi:diguanylate cyclase (GGDEF)-like protein/PAS domain S-box-containing protein